MQCAIRHRQCSSLENIDVEQQQQSLFDVSIIKLQHEQLRHGVEPRLLRFVLINNALRSLQCHKLHSDDEDNLVGISDELQYENNDIFIYNTFKDGSLSSVPMSPPTPVKMIKLDANFSNQSPLVDFQETPVSSPVPPQDVSTSLGEERVHPAADYDGESCECGGEGGGDRGGGGGGIEGGGASWRDNKKLQNGFMDVHTSSAVHLGKRPRDKSSEEPCLNSREALKCRAVEVEEEDLETSDSGDAKKSYKPSTLVLNGLQKVNALSSLNGLHIALDLDPLPPLPLPSSPPPLSSHNHHHTNSHHHSTADDSDKDSLTPSPIDFTNVDTSMYDFDTAAYHVGATTDHTSGLVSQQSTPSLPVPMTISPATPSSSSASTVPSLHFPQVVSSEKPSLPETNGVVSSSENASNSNSPETEKRSLLSANSTVMTAGNPAGKGSSCSMQALNEDDNLSSNCDSINNGILPASPEHVVEPDYLDEIVSLLMT